MSEKLKVAICLTGLVRNTSAVPAYIKQIFTKIGNDNDIEFDYYCHFWKNDKPYPYNINEDWLGIASLPKEDETSVKHVVATLNPKAVTYNCYSDMLPTFLNHGLLQYIDYSNHLDLFIDKKIDKDFFMSIDSNNPTKYFDCWWEFHNDWVNFAHLTSQFFAIEQCLKTVVSSDTRYDAILRWRYDQLFLTSDYHINKLVENLKNTHRNHIVVEWMYRGKWGVTELIPVTNTSQVNDPKLATLDKPLDVTVSDSWWIVDADTAAFMSKYLTIAYADIRKYHKIFWLRGAGQHAFFYYALVSMKINFNIVGSIGSNLIRDPSILPPIDDLSELSIIDSDLIIKIAKVSGQRSSFAKQLENSQDKKYVYDVIKNFKFVSKEKL